MRLNLITLEFFATNKTANMDTDFKVLNFPLEDNLNNKFGADYLVHIHRKANTKIGPAHFGTMVVKFAGDKDENLYVLNDYADYVMSDLGVWLIGCSHGMMRQKFYEYMHAKFNLYPCDKVGIYFFTKLTFKE